MYLASALVFFGAMGTVIMRNGFVGSKAFKKPTTLLIGTLLVAGCAVNGNTLPQLTASEELVTNSVVEKAKPEGVDNTDAEVIKTVVASASADEGVKPLAWQNPETGSSGTIVAIDKFMGKHGQHCRGFKTSVDTFMGIAFYDGEACQISPGEWVLSWFKPSE